MVVCVCEEMGGGTGRGAVLVAQGDGVCVCEGGGAQRGGQYWWLREMVCVCV